MRYFVTVGGRTFEVSIDGDRVSIDGERIEASLIEVAGTPVRRLSMGGASHRVVARAGDARGAWDLHLDGQRLAADVVDERTRAIRAMTNRAGVASGPKPVRAPMPGMIVRVEVKPGDHVRAGQGVAVIEAMKMENELKAEVAGVVAKVAVAAGTAVEKGAMLIEFLHAEAAG
ncbi:MAG TPA: biotin/lipoyl-containing protein [Longimicrobiales bacterium]